MGQALGHGLAWRDRSFPTQAGRAGCAPGAIEPAAATPGVDGGAIGESQVVGTLAYGLAWGRRTGTM